MAGTRLGGRNNGGLRDAETEGYTEGEGSNSTEVESNRQPIDNLPSSQGATSLTSITQGALRSWLLDTRKLRKRFSGYFKPGSCSSFSSNAKTHPKGQGIRRFSIYSTKNWIFFLPPIKISRFIKGYERKFYFADGKPKCRRTIWNNKCWRNAKTKKKKKRARVTAVRYIWNRENRVGRIKPTAHSTFTRSLLW